MQPNIHLPIYAWLLLGAALACTAYVCLAYCLRLNAVRRARQASAKMPANGSFPSLSVIVFARDEPMALEQNLPLILQQDYPAPFEVIVVNDGASSDTSMAVGRLKMQHPNLYLTFTPDGARNLSRKKLGLTIGIKAAKGDVVVITDAESKPLSHSWLKTVAAPFADPAVEVALPYGAVADPKRRMAGRLTRLFDCAADSVAWLSGAISGNPYRGCGSNLAYRRSLFFANKGFSRSLNLRDGDDDIFISEIANGANTAVLLAPEADSEREFSPFKRQTMRHRVSHAFTGRRLSKASRRMMAAGEWCLWLVPIFGAAAAWVAGLANPVGWGAALLLTIVAWAAAAIAWTRTLKALRTPCCPAALPLQAMTRPLRNIAVSIRSRIGDNAHYTWQ